MNCLRKIYRSLLRKPESSAEYCKRSSEHLRLHTGNPNITVQDASGVNAIKHISGEEESLPCHPEDNCPYVDYSIDIRAMDIARRGPR